LALWLVATRQTLAGLTATTSASSIFGLDFFLQEFDPFLLLLQLALGAMVGLKDGCSVLE